VSARGDDVLIDLTVNVVGSSGYVATAVPAWTIVRLDQLPWQQTGCGITLWTD
jgi:hypothetical protein